MAIDGVDRTVPAQAPLAAREPVVVQDRRGVPIRPVASSGPGASEQVRRIVVLLFGLIQILIGARFVLLLLDAREANGLVSGILNLSQVFVAPFEGILKADSLHAAGSVLDLSAILAFVGWTLVELIVIWAVAIFRRDRVSTGA